MVDERSYHLKLGLLGKDNLKSEQHSHRRIVEFRLQCFIMQTTTYITASFPCQQT